MIIEIKYNKNYQWYELWQHFLNNPKDILYPINYSNNIWHCYSKDFLIKMAIEKFKINYYQIKFTNGKD